MKKIVYLIAILPLLLACNTEFFKMDETDAQTGLRVKGDGLKCETVEIQVDGEKITRNYFYQGEKVDFIFKDIYGLKRIKQLAYPELSIVIKTKEGDIVNETKDALGDQGHLEFPLKIIAYFEAAFDRELGSEFDITITIKDKKGDGIITASMPFEVVPNPNITVNAVNTTYDMVYLWDEDEKKVITSDYISPGKTYYLVVQGLENIKSPVVPLEIMDENGELLFTNPDIFDDVSPDEAAKFLKHFSAEFYVPRSASGPVTVRVKVIDEESDNSLVAETTVKI